ncbi:hypothetical protein IV38_GL001029 [Lactobacillus selangorensis]|uniref:Uncharacterized protein n=1 Tax=Lactobacillus selangorensis TaxID=81857 RepID=A0A0R2FWN2_9LACO|nr:hypothetical protein [Lactobacillus selangorensis]KRN28823.1 hypothetical protein IV38_GL001029 [Lactobacillus selangorensis]KRN32767.1 hypothetical protein IV40_GL000825 [Lactobacillus selangorensis]
MAKNMSSKGYRNVANTFQKKGNTEWAEAKSGKGGYHYGNARGFYNTARIANAKADELEKKGK